VVIICGSCKQEWGVPDSYIERKRKEGSPVFCPKCNQVIRVNATYIVTTKYAGGDVG
jgi:NAD-dependent SIR2 family protein deacetylase